MRFLHNKFSIGKEPEIFYLEISICIIFIYFSPYFIWGQDCLIQISDNLDANIPYYKIIAQNARETGWSGSIVPQVMNGLPKSSFLTQWNLTYLLYYLFPAFTAYVIHLMLVALIAFFGMLKLLKILLAGEQHYNNPVIIYGTALCFAILPFYPSAGISIAGQPLLLAAFLNINRGNLKPWNFMIILLFPFYSSLVFGGVFFLIILACWSIYKIIYNRQNLTAFIIAAILLALSYAFTEHNLLFNYFVDQGNSIVEGQGILFTNTFAVSLLATLKLLVYGFTAHANVFQFPVILFSIVTALLLLIFKRRIYSKTFLFLLLVTLLVSFISGFYSWNAFTPVKEFMPVFKSFDFSRFSFLLPLMFYLLFFYSLIIIDFSFKKAIIVVLLLVIMQLGFNFKRNSNNRTLYYKFHELVAYDRTTSQDLTYRQYFSENLFNKVKEYIGESPENYRILCLGIEPGVLLYNGFYTLDGYNSYYPLEYKQTFRKIIEKEIEKNESIRIDFDIEGSLCYLFSSELTRGRHYTKANPAVVNNLEINSQEIKNLGGKYIVSGVEIKNFAQNNLFLSQTFEDNESLYRIFLYKVL